MGSSAHQLWSVHAEGPVPRLAARHMGQPMPWWFCLAARLRLRATATFYHVLLLLLPVPVTHSFCQQKECYEPWVQPGPTAHCWLEAHCFPVHPIACSARCFLLAPSCIPTPPPRTFHPCPVNMKHNNYLLHLKPLRIWRLVASFSSTFHGFSNPEFTLVSLLQLCFVGSIQNSFNGHSLTCKGEKCPPLNQHAQQRQRASCHFLLLSCRVFGVRREADTCR